MFLSRLLGRRHPRTAPEWLAKSLSGAMSDREFEAFERWLAEPPNAREFRLAEQLWLAAPAYTPARPETDAASTGSAARVAAVRPRVAAAAGRTRPPARRVALAAGVAVLVAGGAGSLLWMLSFSHEVIEVGAGERALVTLQDRSTVHLNARTRLNTAYGLRSRWIEMDQGEAFFSVAHDARRPFVVESGDARITALGTRFNVRRRHLDALAVDVVEGAVRVDMPGVTRRIPAGRRLELRHGQVLVGQADLSRVQGWRDGLIVIDSVPLEQVVDDLNLYASQPIGIADDRLKLRRVSGRFDPSRSDEALAAVALAVGAEVRRAPDGRTVLADAVDAR